jgi:peptide/nickel transport system substrate-binding protein
LLLLIACSVACQMTPDAEEHAVRGGRLVVAQPAGPRTFNPLFADDSDSLSLAGCLMATLIRINRQTQKTELELAESATWSPDGRVMTARLRPDIRFSDGQPLTVEDILFTFQVIYDPNIASSIRDLLQRGGEKIDVEKVDDRTVRFTFPGPYAAADRLFSGVHILPKHVLERPYREGKFESAWGLSTPPEQVIGLGPYRLQAYEQGQRTVLVRNPHYWKRAAGGAPLPYLDRIDFLIIPDKSARLLKFQQGELDLLQALRPEDVEALRTLLDRGEVVVYDLGPSLITDFLWFNLNPGTDPRLKTQDPRPQTNNNGPATSNQRPATKYVDPVKLAWFSDTRFRQAIAYAINRQEIVDVVFSGAATPLFGPVTGRKGLV